jgi:hypothetical protein
VDAAEHAGAGLEHPPEDVLLADDVEVVREVGGAGHRVHQAGEVGQPADAFELLRVAEALLERDEIDRRRSSYMPTITE